MSIGTCPGCLSDVSIRTILWGLPTEQPDPDLYVTGGCCIEENMPEMQCIKCDWQGSFAEVEHATRVRRFIWAGEDLPGMIFYKKFRITHEVLTALEASQVWQSTVSFKSMFTAESIFGPEGKLRWLWNSSWDTEDAMRSDLYTNMGGGVPVEILEELIRLIID